MKPKIRSQRVSQVMRQSSKTGVSDINMISKLDNKNSFRRNVSPNKNLFSQSFHKKNSKNQNYYFEFDKLGD